MTSRHADNIQDFIHSLVSHCSSLFTFSNLSLFLDVGKIFVDKNAIKHTFSHDGENYFSVVFNREFFLVLREFWTIFSRTHWKAVYKQTFPGTAL